MMKLKMVSLLAVTLLLVSCSKEGGQFKEGKILASKQVSKDTLNLGQTTYMEYCVQCHGKKGDGKGVSSAGMFPPPRDFTLGIYKFGNVVSGELPHDEDFYRIIRGGLHGTAMLPWDISDKRLDAVTQYIKTFAPAAWEGEDKKPGTTYELPADPFGEGKKAEAIEKGKRAYHITASCIQCHRGYETKADMSAFNKEINNVPLKADEFASDLYLIKMQDSDFGYKTMPPDFTYHVVRTAHSTEDIVKRLMYGVNGSGMPGWKDVVTDEELWALAYYVQSLKELRNTPGREALMSKLENQ
jgi:mono/diheme cytochrome c family protein